MRIREEDVNELATYLQARYDEGRYLLSYDRNNEFFEAGTTRTFDNDFDALMDSYDQRGKDQYKKVVPLEPILEAVKELNNAFALSGTTSLKRSLPFNLELIVSNFNYKQELNKNAMEIGDVRVEELSPLAKTLKYSGMGKVSNEELNQKMAEGQDVFTIGFKTDFKDVEAEAVIHCAKSNKGNYFADSYDIIVREKDKEDLQRNYKFGRISTLNIGGQEQKVNTTYTFKEAFNQMQGRSVFKTFVFVDKDEPKNNRKYEAWESINFSQTDANGNFKTEKHYDLDVEKKVKSLSLVENMDYENHKMLCESLKRGNVQSAKYVALDGSQEMIYLEANGRFKMINAYDKDMNPINLHEKRKMELDALEHHKQSQKEGTKVEQKQEEKKEKKSRGIRA